VSLKEILDAFNQLSREHQAVVKDIQFNASLKPESLINRIQPMIVRLNEGKHANEVSGDGPLSPHVWRISSSCKKINLNIFALFIQDIKI
jgi:hypothetical protein